MENLLQLWNEWEIHFLVLLSFTLQTFLFFAGGLRPRNTNTFVRLSVWFAYLGADFVAVYAFGFLSRQQDNTTGGREGTLGKNHQLTFFWAPFLIIHLGGKDTITALAIEDNNLWLRHLLNLSPCYAGLICLLEINRFAQLSPSSPRHLFVCFWNYQVWGKDIRSQVWEP
jgi:hypothetical protein